MPKRWSRTPVLLTLLSVALLAPATAHASFLQIEDSFDDEHLFTADPGDVNDLVVTTTGLAFEGDGNDDVDNVVFEDREGDPIDVENNDTDRCSGEGTAIVTCTGDVYLVEANLGDMNDTGVASGTIGVDFFGNDGTDTLTGIDGDLTRGDNEFLSGGEGNDRIELRRGDDEANGNEGIDTIDAGAGNDTITDRGGEGNDTYTGGDGLDGIEYQSDNDPPDTFGVDLTAARGGRTNSLVESDALNGFEDVVTDIGADVVTGTAGSNLIDTSDEDEDEDDGNDQVNPLGGADTVETGSGNDNLDLRDGANDRGLCGPGTDTVQADQFDELTDCENVSLAQVRAENADLAPPGCVIAAGVKSRYSRRAFFRGFTPMWTAMSRRRSTCSW